MAWLIAAVLLLSAAQPILAFVAFGVALAFTVWATIAYTLARRDDARRKAALRQAAEAMRAAQDARMRPLRDAQAAANEFQRIARQIDKATNNEDSD